MNDLECQGMANSYLRLVSSLHINPKKRMTFCTQSVSEQQLVLVAIQQFVEVMNSGKVLTAKISKQNKRVGTIEVFVEDSKEMSS